MVLVRERDVLDAAGWCGGVDEELIVAFEEVLPFEEWVLFLAGLHHAGVLALGGVGLVRHGCVELAHSLLDGLHDMGFELGEVFLDGEDVGADAVFFPDLLVQPVYDATM